MANRELSPWTRGTGMSLYGSRDPFSNFRREMDRLFEDFFAPVEGRSFAAPAAAQTSGLGVWPTIDVDENEQAYIVSAELPGIDPKDVELNLKDNALTLSGEKRSERNEEQQGRRYSERSFGRFQRTIPFDVEIDADRVEANCDNGVLKITLPKNPKAREQSKRIEIKPQAKGASGDGGGAASQGGGPGR